MQSYTAMKQLYSWANAIVFFPVDEEKEKKEEKEEKVEEWRRRRRRRRRRSQIQCSLLQQFRINAVQLYSWTKAIVSSE